MAITRRQREVYDFISRFVSENGYSPSFDEIGKGLDLNSLATVHKHITNLEKKGCSRATTTEAARSTCCRPKADSSNPWA